MMKKQILPLLIAGLCLINVQVQAESEGAARVNGTMISKARLDVALESTLQQSGVKLADIKDPKQVASIREEILDQLVIQEMLWQEAESKKLMVPEQQVSDVMEKMKEQFPDPAVFEANLKKGGFTEESYRQDIKKRITVRQLIKQEVVDKVEVADKDVSDFYEKNKDKMVTQDEIHARHILIKLSPNASEEEQIAAKDRIDAVLAKAKAGEDFAELAKTNSEGPSKVEGGDLGFFGAGRMVPEFEKAAFALKDGEVSEVVRTQFGYHIIKREDSRTAGIIPLEQASGEIRQYLAAERVKRDLQAMIEKLREKAKIEIL